MRIGNLEEVSLEAIKNTFNKAFSDYSVKVEYNLEQFANKLKSESIDLNISTGAFRNDILVGFILHGSRVISGKKTFYNAGTGVIPEERGQQITGRMYEYILPHFKHLKFDQGLLEVISDNHRAIKIYEKVGFKISRNLECYKGTMHKSAINSQLRIVENETFNPSDFLSHWDWMPSWQHQTTTLEYLKDKLKTIVAEMDDLPVAYMIYDPEGLRIKQFAVHKFYRNKGIASGMFNHIPSNKDLFVINVDGNDQKSNKFLEGIGLNRFLRQYEMKLILPNQ